MQTHLAGPTDQKLLCPSTWGVSDNAGTLRSLWAQAQLELVPRPGQQWALPLPTLLVVRENRLVGCFHFIRGTFGLRPGKCTFSPAAQCGHRGTPSWLSYQVPVRLHWTQPPQLQEHCLVLHRLQAHIACWPVKCTQSTLLPSLFRQHSICTQSF